MPKKYLISAAGALVVILTSGIAVLLVRRSQRESAPIAPTPPRVEQLANGAGESAPQTS